MDEQATYVTVAFQQDPSDPRSDPDGGWLVNWTTNEADAEGWDGPRLRVPQDVYEGIVSKHGRDRDAQAVYEELYAAGAEEID